MKWFGVLVALFVAPVVALSSEGSDPKLVAHLLGYVALDYPAAVSRGRVISEGEYAEMREFARMVREMARENPQLSASATLGRDLDLLQARIEARASATEVADLARSAQGQVIRAAGIAVSPDRWPSRTLGTTLYENGCATCHGGSGRGDGIAGMTLDPRPANFHDGERMSQLSPFQAFQAIRLGVPGTGMASFPHYSDEQAWALAFYVVSIRHAGEAPAGDRSRLAFNLAEVASSPDRELVARADQQSGAADLAALRCFEGESEDPLRFIPRAKEGLAAAAAAAGRRSWDEARRLAVEAYLEGLEPVEPRLRARDAAMTVRLERAMSDVRVGIDQRLDQQTILQRVAVAVAGLTEADVLLRSRESSPWFAFWVAAGIFLREAFESVLILVTLLGLARQLALKRAVAALHAGWITAVVLGLGAWFVSGRLIEVSGAQREVLEGVLGLAAVSILIYVGFWLHRRSEIGRWKGFLAQIARSATSARSLLLLGGVSFIAVFREALETVLFLRALVLETGPAGQWAVGMGVLAALIVAVALAAAILRFSVRLPLRQLFTVSSVVMVLLSVLLVGSSIRSLQEAGHVDISPIPLLYSLEWLGIQPSLQALLPQIALLVGALSVWALGRCRDPLRPASGAG